MTSSGPHTSPVSEDAPSLGLDFGMASGLPAQAQAVSPPAAQVSGLLGPGPVAAPAMAPVYRVLARKYRPSGFADLIGQEAMVQTLTNAFKLNRIHQAYLLTGVRGVGKTTTARILARAFNYEVAATETTPAVTQPTVDMPVMGIHCQAIIESRHIDVIEMDAASNTSVDDVREIIEGARFRPVMARTKVYIIDEVHMLSKSAFNALLKTLEEPPDHVKFLFATTEIDKVPITVRSRCQRFDLRRVGADVLTHHLMGICQKEAVAVAPDALALIARAAEGSVRDALSILDQAIAHGADATGAISAEGLRAMLGVADRTRLMDMFDSLMRADVASGLAILKDQYNQGADPHHILADLADLVHSVTRQKIAPSAEPDPTVPLEEQARSAQFAARLSVSVLSRAWQILSKGLQDIKDSPRPLAAADMVLVRLAYAADLPSPEDVLRRLSSSPGGPGPTPGTNTSHPTGGLNPGMVHTQASPAMAGARPPQSLESGARPVRMAITQAHQVANPTPQSQTSAILAPAAGPTPAPQVRLQRFEDVVALAGVHRDIQLKIALERDVRLVRFDQGAIDFALTPGASPQIAQTLMRRLQEWTGQRWMVALSREDGASSLKEQSDARDHAKLVGVRANPLVQQVLAHFPGAEIVAIRAPDHPGGAPHVTSKTFNTPSADPHLNDDIQFGVEIEDPDRMDAEGFADTDMEP